MNKIKRFLFFLNVFFLLKYIKFVFADLPIHALIKDIKGDWRFYVTESFDGIADCGSDPRNYNLRNLREEIKDYKQFLKNRYGGFNRIFDLRLTSKPFSFKDLMQDASKKKDESHRNLWNSLAVFKIDENEKNLEQKPVGFWTSIYDEGFEVIIGPVHFTAILNYMPLTSEDNLTNVSSRLLSACNARNKLNEQDYHCYLTNSSKIKIGWYTEEKKDSLNGIVTGCFYAEKINYKNKNNETLNTSQYNKTNSNSLMNNLFTQNNTYLPPLSYSSFVVISYANKNKNIFNNKLAYSNKYFVNRHNRAHTNLWKAKVNDFLFDEKQKTYFNKIFNEGRNGKKNQPNLAFFQHRKIKKIHLNDERYQSTSFFQQQKISSSEIQLYACPCKSNDKILDTSNSFEKVNKLNVVAPPLKPSFISTSLDFRKKITEEVNNESKNLPKNFSWGDPYNNDDFVPEIQSQASCGSCYVMATEFALRKRFEIEVKKMIGKKIDLFQGESLSTQFVLACSMYNQGCDGGYPYLVGKFFKEIGVPVSSCIPYKSNDKVSCPIKYLSAKSKSETSISTSNNCTTPDKRWYAKSYGYVGGCYQCNSCNGERNMQEEIFAKGPIMAAIDVSAPFLFYSDGVFDSLNINSHERTCDDYESNKNLTGWEFTNHAVALVGWGEEIINNKVVKYWIGRNSWGDKWGRKGYFKIVRGQNIGGIENQSTWIDPDFSRGQGKYFYDNFIKRSGTDLKN